MHHPSRPPNPSDGSTPVTGTPGSGGDPPPVGAAAKTSRSDGGGERSDSTGGGEPDSPSWYRTRASSPVASLGVFQTRSIFHLPRRASSGYFSFEADSLPSSPLSSPLSPRPAAADRATQTPSPTGQLVKHALQRLADAHGAPGTQQQHGSSPSSSSSRRRADADVDMQTDAIGRELRRIGDDFNIHLLRGMAGGPRRAEIRPAPPLHQEPTVLLCLGVLLLLIGRMIYLHGGTSSQDHSQV